MNNFLIGALDPNDAGVFVQEGDVDFDKVVTPNAPEVPEVTEGESDKKPNYFLYGVLGIIAIAIIMGNRK